MLGAFAHKTAATDNGDAAGKIEISARSVVITGQLIAAGEHGGSGTGGAGGALDIRASAALSLAGKIDTFGGDSDGANNAV